MRSCSILVAVGLTLLLTASAVAQVPQMINYQGKISGSSGTCLDTVVQMVFSIYADGYTTTYLWRETQTDVSVEKGVFSVNLGSYTPIPTSVFDGSIKFLGVKVGGDAEMSPRKQITSTGYAYRSQNTDVWDAHHWGDTYPSAANSDQVDGVHGTQFLRNDQSGTLSGNLAVTGNQGVGTTNPQAKLDVRGDIRLHADGSLYASGGVENLRIIRGTINTDGSIAAGSGFSVSSPGDGQYTITFSAPFASPPSVVLSARGSAPPGDPVAWFAIANTETVSSSDFTVRTRYQQQGGTSNVVPGVFDFIAVGPR